MNIDTKQLKTAKNYALALFEIGKSYDCAEKMYSDLQTLVETLNSSEDLREYLQNPVIPINDKKEVVYKVFEKYLDIQIINFLNVLVDNKRCDVIETVYECYKEIYEDYTNVVRLEVISAVSLTDDTKGKIVSKMEKKLNKKVTPVYETDEKILGGLIIKIKDKVIDLSLSSKIKNMEKQLI